jgi:hypothetical protein
MMKKIKINFRKISRKIALSQGAYDGRFISKVVTNKKKKFNKEFCKKFKY